MIVRRQSVSHAYAYVPAPSVFPLAYSADARTLKQANGVPFPILGRTAWAALSLSWADQQSFVADTASKGFNAIEIWGIIRHPNANHAPTDGDGNAPFNLRLSGAAWGGAFDYGQGTSAPDFTTPNAAYWSNVDRFLNLCKASGILVMFFPAYVGFGGTATSEGWMMEMLSNGATKMQSYGTWLASRYSAQSNVAWMMGGDYVPTPGAEANAETALRTGLDTSVPTKLFSAEWASGANSADQTVFGAMTLNGVYNFGSSGFAFIASQGLTAYDQWSTVRNAPAFLLEEPYDEEGSDGTNVNGAASQPVRRYIWWGWLTTIGGYMAGNGYVWPFTAGWTSHINSIGAQDLARLNAFIKSFSSWPMLVPSGHNGMGTIVTAGGSAASQHDFVSAAASTDKRLCVAYVPPEHTGTIAIDMTVMAGSTLARWFNPFTEAYVTIASGLANTGTQTFTPGGNNGSGYTDWVLVLTA